MTMIQEFTPVALVSGGSKGLGFEIVERFLKIGYAVATCSRNRSEQIDALISTYGPEKLCWESVDMTSLDSLSQFVVRSAKLFKRIDVLVNNAGKALEGLLPLTSVSDIHETIAANLEGAIVLARAVSRIMLRQGVGSIVNISSVNGLRGHTGVAVYSATKAGLDGLTRSLARELGPRGIRVNSIAPGYFESEMTVHLNAEQRQRIVRRTPLGRLANVSDIVDMVEFLASSKAAFVTGQVIAVDGGLTC